jgi:hypothetical protein
MHAHAGTGKPSQSIISLWFRHVLLLNGCEENGPALCGRDGSVLALEPIHWVQANVWCPELVIEVLGVSFPKGTGRRPLSAVSGAGYVSRGGTVS